MQALCVRWFMVAVFAASLSAVSSRLSAEPRGVRDIRRLALEGVEAVSVADVQWELLQNFDVTLAAHPDVPLEAYLRALESCALLGYQHSGFRDAQVAARYDEQQERIVVHVTEGERHICGDVKITGLKNVAAAPLIESVAGPTKKNSMPCVKDRPAPFDELTAREIRKRLKDAFAAQGYFSPSLTARIAADPGEKAARLEVDVKDEGPRAEIGHITLTGNKRDSEDDILKYLDLRPGQPYDSRLAERLKERLDASGRYVSAKIDRSGPQRVFEGGREIVPLTIELREYEAAPPLDRDLSPAERAAVHVRRWFERWSRGESGEDIVLTATLDRKAMTEFWTGLGIAPPGKDEGIESLELTTIIAPQRGQIFLLKASKADGTPIIEEALILEKDRLTLAAPLRKARLQFPHAGTVQFELTLELKGNEPSEERPFSFMFGLTWHLRDEASQPIKVETKLSTAGMVSLVHGENAKCELRDDVWHVKYDNGSGRFEDLTGRPIEFHFTTEENGPSFSVRCARGAFDAAATQIDARLTETAIDYSPKSPWKSLVLFYLDEWSFASQQLGMTKHQASAVALRKLVERWSMPTWQDLVDCGNEDKSKQPFDLPLQKREYDFEDIFLKATSQRGQNAVAVIMALYRRLGPQTGWYWPAGRDYLLQLGSGTELSAQSLRRIAESDEIGPAGELLLTSLRDSALTAVAARTGLKRITLDAFRRDYEPLLAGDSWSSKWLLSLVEAIRSLDDGDLQTIAGLVDDDTPMLREMIFSLLRLLKEEPEQSPAEAASRALSVLWRAGLSDAVSSALKKAAGPDSAKPEAAVAGAAQPRPQETPAPRGSITASTDRTENAVTQQLRALGLLEEIQSPAPRAQSSSIVMPGWPGLAAYDGEMKSIEAKRASGDQNTDNASSSSTTPPADGWPSYFQNQQGTFKSAPSTYSASPAPSAQRKATKPILATVQPGDVVAKVGDKEIRYEEVAPTVALIMAPVLAKTTTLAQRQAVEAQRELLTENVIRQFVQNKMLLIEFERSIPRALLRDSKKKAEADAKLQKNIRQAFDGALRTAREKIANAPQEEVDKLLRQDATIVRLALLMKDHRLDSDEALDTALREFGSSLDQQVKQYGEYMCGIEGARSELDRRKRTTITPQAIAECYQDHLADYHVPAKARFEILTARFARFDGDRQATREHAAKMADEVRGGKPLADVARGLSQEPRADEGGYYDWVSAGSLISQPIDQAVFSLEVGELSEPIEDSLGYHIVRVIERQKDRQILLDEARPVIEALLKEKHRTEDQQRYLQDLKSRTPVWTIYDDDDAPRTAAKP